MFHKIYGGGRKNAHPGCEAPKYEPECCPVEVCNPCGETCPPKTRASEAIILEANEVERCFPLTSFGCPANPIYANQHCFSMEIRKRGSCTLLTTLLPVRALPTGEVCFAWGGVWDEVSAGYYEADLYIDGKNCNTLLFKLRECSIMVHSSTPIIDITCPIPDPECCGSTPQIDDTPPVPAECDSTCDECENE